MPPRPVSAVVFPPSGSGVPGYPRPPARVLPPATPEDEAIYEEHEVDGDSYQPSHIGLPHSSQHDLASLEQQEWYWGDITR